MYMCEALCNNGNFYLLLWIHFWAHQKVLCRQKQSKKVVGWFQALWGHQHHQVTWYSLCRTNFCRCGAWFQIRRTFAQTVQFCHDCSGSKTRVKPALASHNSMCSTLHTTKKHAFVNMCLPRYKLSQSNCMIHVNRPTVAYQLMGQPQQTVVTSQEPG